MRRVALFAVLAPVTGPLIAGVLRHRRTAPALATLYALALVLWLAEAGPILHGLLSYIGGSAHG